MDERCSTDCLIAGMQSSRSSIVYGNNLNLKASLCGGGKMLRDAVIMMENPATFHHMMFAFVIHY